MYPKKALDAISELAPYYSYCSSTKVQDVFLARIQVNIVNFGIVYLIILISG
jgi:hypothetical protein